MNKKKFIDDLIKTDRLSNFEDEILTNIQDEIDQEICDLNNLKEKIYKIRSKTTFQKIILKDGSQKHILKNDYEAGYNCKDCKEKMYMHSGTQRMYCPNCGRDEEYVSPY